jgi:hypothetical protein
MELDVMRLTMYGVLLLVLFASTARGQNATEAQPRAEASGAPAFATPGLTDAYCEYVEGTADSEAARLLAPNLFSTVGVFNAEVAPTPSPISASERSRGRVLAGGELGLGNVARGLALKRRALADCEAYRISVDLESFLQNNSNAVTTGALAAKAAILREALPRGAAIVEAAKKSVESGAGTVQEADAARLRLDELRRMLDDTEREMAGATPSEAFRRASLPGLVERAGSLDRELEKSEAGVREAGAWDFTVRGGYDHIFLANEGRPYFAMGTLTFNLGRLRQSGAERRAEEGRRLWLLRQPEGVTARIGRLLRQLRGVQKAEAGRLQETQILLVDLEQRMKSVQEVGGKKAESYASYLWFDYIRVKAESAYLAAHLKDLVAITGEQRDKK